jgi:site-specific recombinase XerD
MAEQKRHLELRKLLLDFLEHMEVERQVSTYTIRNYHHYLSRFIEWLERNYPEAQLKDINLPLLTKYRVYLARYVGPKGETLGKSTQGYYVISLRSFFKWMIKHDIEIIAPEKIDLPKSESKSLKYLTMEQLERMMNQPRLATKIGLRDRVIMEVLFSTGLRVSELVSLNREQVNTDRREFGVIGKGRKLRVVFLSSRANEWLERYVATRDDAWQPVFVRYSRGKAPITSDGEEMRLTPRSVQRIVEKYRRKARLPIPITPHGLRHTFATDLIGKGAGLREVQEMLGHKNVATTQIYTHVTNPKLREVHEKYHSGNE